MQCTRVVLCITSLTQLKFQDLQGGVEIQKRYDDLCCKILCHALLLLMHLMQLKFYNPAGLNFEGGEIKPAVTGAVIGLEFQVQGVYLQVQ